MSDRTRTLLYLRALIDADGRLPEPALEPVRLSVRTAGSIPPKAVMAAAGYIVVVWTWRIKPTVTRTEIEEWETGHAEELDVAENQPQPMSGPGGSVTDAESGAVPSRRKLAYHGTVLARRSVFAPPGRTLQTLWGAWGEGRVWLESVLSKAPDAVTPEWLQPIARTVVDLRTRLMDGDPDVTVIDPSLPL
ncbi:hypothetical protein [Elioraea sp.]|uniref:hypothetical protein n=1 Tax=Elioraea sp. TaxID=2185103 RepID=UPI003F728698